jgi:hypothetical protein
MLLIPCIGSGKFMTIHQQMNYVFIQLYYIEKLKVSKCFDSCRITIMVSVYQMTLYKLTTFILMCVVPCIVVITGE